MNHALTSNHPSGSICVNPLDYLELRLDLLPSPPYKENGFPHIGKAVKADVDVPSVRPDRVRSAVFSPLYSWLLQWLFIKREEPPLALSLPDPEKR